MIVINRWICVPFFARKRGRKKKYLLKNDFYKKRGFNMHRKRELEKKIVYLFF